MKRCIVLSLGLLISFAANAADSCAVQSARLLSQGKVSDLAKMFAKPGDAVSQSLERIAAEIGSVRKVLPAKHASAGESARQSVAAEGLPASYAFDGSWAVIVTKAGERFQLQASAEPKSSCKLLAIHLDKFSK